MSQLLYKARSSTDISGKPKVYFCCHPDDFEECFEPLAEEILAVSNCSVWYNSCPLEDYDDEFLADLSQMQMFVVPVTTRFLTEKNNGRISEFNLAVNENIPILPILLESGLESLFNEKCGELQCLDKNLRDVTAISYEEKFEKFLSDVLIGDEVLNKIRNEFDGYMFLSYRKKDRLYARELMKLLHKNDECRDIAIWYDEFLTPGENFNNSISDALEKSNIFVLAVTPNLINEQNYVMTTEYPMAKEAGKEIFPVELVATDENELKIKYEGIPKCVAAYSDAFESALLKKVQKVNIKSNDKNPKHNFYIGMAYLGGVDVELDYERAFLLIKDSAENGFIDAVDKLIQMYRNGHGVKRSYENAVLWQEKKTELLYGEYEKEPDLNKLGDLFWEVLKLGDFYEELGILEKAEKEYEKALSLISNAEFEETDFRGKTTAVFCKLGSVMEQKGEKQKAEEFYAMSIEIDEKIAEEIANDTAYYNLLLSYMRMTSLLSDGNDTGKRRRYCEKIMELSEKLDGKFKSFDMARIKSIAYEAMGDVLLAEGKYEESKIYFDKFLESALFWADEEKSTEALRDLAVAYSRKGEFYGIEGDLFEAYECFKKMLDIFVEIDEKKETIKSKFDLAHCYSKMASLLNEKGDISAAKGYVEKSLETKKALWEKTGLIEINVSLVEGFNNLGEILEKEGNLKEALSCYEKGLDYALEISRKTDGDEICKIQAECYKNMGDVFCEEGKLEEARNVYQKVVSLLLKMKNSSLEYLRALVLVYGKLANIEELERNFDKALDYVGKMFEIIGEFEKRSDFPIVKNDFAVCCNQAGDILKEIGDFKAAYSFYLKTKEILEEEVKTAGTIKSRFDLFLSYDRVSAMLRAIGKHEEANEYYFKMLEMAKVLSLETNSVDSFDCLAVAYVKMSYVSEDTKIEYLEKAAKIYERLSANSENTKRYKNCLDDILKEIAKTEPKEEISEVAEEKDNSKPTVLNKIKSFFGF